MTFCKVRYRKNARPVIHLFFTSENTALSLEEATPKDTKLLLIPFQWINNSFLTFEAET